jgi:GNAT superfamily N-acetyltransferase
VLRESPLPELPSESPDDVASEVGRNVASLVDDGSTLQLGIGQVPNATLAALGDRKDLGVWTEMFSDGIIDLIENGNITGKNKTIHPGKVTSSFTFGSKHLYEFVDRNPVFTFHPSDFTNNPIHIAQQYKMVTINSALQIDVTGQVCADSIGDRFYSGIGGQVDFIRGASMCPGGKAIIALRSTAKQGSISRIVCTLDEGAGVVTSRGDVRFVVTEFGIADLQGRSIRERANALISIAHPDFRAELLSATKERRYIFADQITSRAPYPQAHESRVTTSKGDVLLRPIRIIDEEKMSDLFYRLSQQSIYKRWLHLLTRMPHKDILYYLNVDYSKTMALVVDTASGGEESEIVAVGRYHTDPRTDYAEVAFVVRDDWQGHGLATLLLKELIRIARQNGVVGFTAEVLGTNDAMLHVFHKSGLKVQSSLADGEYSLKMTLSDEGESIAQ